MVCVEIRAGAWVRETISSLEKKVNPSPPLHKLPFFRVIFHFPSSLFFTPVNIKVKKNIRRDSGPRMKKAGYFPKKEGEMADESGRNGRMVE